ncbi:hypothetical protein NMY22_g2111 [Coprinellus aureogranulatus]|nr:hypothetical protein NMY22_g2111 [Coprinellus aureogranulatus]
MRRTERTELLCTTLPTGAFSARLGLWEKRRQDSKEVLKCLAFQICIWLWTDEYFRTSPRDTTDARLATSLDSVLKWIMNGIPVWTDVDVACLDSPSLAVQLFQPSPNTTGTHPSNVVGLSLNLSDVGNHLLVHNLAHPQISLYSRLCVVVPFCSQSTEALSLDRRSGRIEIGVFPALFCASGSFISILRAISIACVHLTMTRLCDCARSSGSTVVSISMFSSTAPVYGCGSRSGSDFFLGDSRLGCFSSQAVATDPSERLDVWEKHKDGERMDKLWVCGPSVSEYVFRDGASHLPAYLMLSPEADGTTSPSAPHFPAHVYRYALLAMHTQAFKLHMAKSHSKLISWCRIASLPTGWRSTRRSAFCWRNIYVKECGCRHPCDRRGSRFARDSAVSLDSDSRLTDMVFPFYHVFSISTPLRIGLSLGHISFIAFTVTNDEEQVQSPIPPNSFMAPEEGSNTTAALFGTRSHAGGHSVISAKSWHSKVGIEVCGSAGFC